MNVDMVVFHRIAYVLIALTGCAPVGESLGSMEPADASAEHHVQAAADAPLERTDAAIEASVHPDAASPPEASMPDVVVVQDAAIPPDLGGHYPTQQYAIAYRTVCDPLETECVETDRTVVYNALIQCAPQLGRTHVQYSISGCARDLTLRCEILTGYIDPHADAEAPSLYVGDQWSHQQDTASVHVETGALYATAGGVIRQNFHVLFSMPASRTQVGATGISGPQGEIWLLGCESF